MRWLTFHEDKYVPAPAYARPLPVMLGYAGKSLLDDRIVNERAMSDVIAVEYVMQGRMRLQQAGVTSIIGPGEVFVLKEGVSHTYAPVAGDTVEKMFIQLLGPVPHQLAPQLQDRVVLTDVSQGLGRFREILRVTKDRRPGFERRLSTLAYDLLLFLLAEDEQHADTASSIPESVRRALSFLADKVNENPSVTAIASAAGVSAPHLFHVFRAHVGMSPRAWLRRQKIEAAKRMLANRSASCKRIALELGFRDPLYFSAVFKRETGQSPTEWRAQPSGETE